MPVLICTISTYQGDLGLKLGQAVLVLKCDPYPGKLRQIPI